MPTPRPFPHAGIKRNQPANAEELRSEGAFAEGGMPSGAPCHTGADAPLDKKCA